MERKKYIQAVSHYLKNEEFSTRLDAAEQFRMFGEASLKENEFTTESHKEAALLSYQYALKMQELRQRVDRGRMRTTSIQKGLFQLDLHPGDEDLQ